jgi:spore coat protein U-like protein
MKRAGLLPIVVLLVGGFAGFLLSQFAEAVVFSMSCTAANSTLTLNGFDPLNPSAVTTPTGSITVSCTSNANQAVTVDYTLQLNSGTTRQLKNGTSTLTYDLYTDSGLTIPWSGTTGTCAAGSNTNVGNVICGSFSVPKSSSANQIKNYYAKVPTSGPTDVPVGTYTQSPAIGVTLIYSCNPAPTGKGTC